MLMKVGNLKDSHGDYVDDKEFSYAYILDYLITKEEEISYCWSISEDELLLDDIKFSNNKILFRNFLRSIHSEDRKEILGLLDEILLGKTKIFEREYRLEDSKKIKMSFLNLSGYVIHGDDNRPVEINGFVKAVVGLRNKYEKKYLLGTNECSCFIEEINEEELQSWNAKIRDSIDNVFTRETEVIDISEVQKCITRITSVLFNSQSIEKALNKALQEIGMLCKADRAYLFEICYDQMVMENTYEWCRKGVEPQIDNLKAVSVSSCPWWMSKLKKNETIFIPDISRMPEEASNEKRLLEMQKIKSLIVIPIFFQNKLRGFVGLDDVAIFNKWDLKEILMLRLFSRVFSGYLFNKEIREKQLNNERRIRKILSNIPGVIFGTLDENLGIIDIGGRFVEISGYTLKDKEAGLNWTDLVLPEDKDRIISDIKNQLKSQNYYETEYRFKTKDGKIKYMWQKGYAIKDEKLGKVIYEGLAIDMTKQRVLEKELIDSNGQLETIIENINSPIFLKNINGGLLRANKAAYSFVGALKGCNEEDKLENMMVENQREHFETDLEIIKSGRRILGETKKHIFANGEILWMRTDKIPYFDNNDSINGLVIISNDITDIIETREKLKSQMKLLENTVDSAINILSKIVEIRDPYTSGHQQRVSELATLIARRMGLSGDKIKGITIAGLLHDIGKICIPPEFLTRPGKLTELEIEVMRTHPERGYEILKEYEFPWPISDIVLQHHEHIDGSGYPNHLKDREILIETKIISVADVVEAISSHRPYRPAYSLDVAIKEMEDKSGVFYDREVVKSCVAILKNHEWSNL